MQPSSDAFLTPRYRPTCESEQSRPSHPCSRTRTNVSPAEGYGDTIGQAFRDFRDNFLDPPGRVGERGTQTPFHQSPFLGDCPIRPVTVAGDY